MDDTSLALVGLSDGTLCAIRLISGQMLWKRKYPSLAGSVKLIYHDGLLFSMSFRGLLVAYHLVDREQEWAVNLPGDPTIRTSSDVQMLAGQSIVVVRYGNTISAFDLQTGSQRWSYRSTACSTAFRMNLLAMGASHVYLSEQFPLARTFDPSLFVGLSAEQIEVRKRHMRSNTLTTFALALDGGTIRWQTERYSTIFADSGGASSLLEVDNIVYSFRKGLYALNADTGEVLWAQESVARAIDGELVADARRIFLSAPGHLGAYWRATGERVWTWPTAPSSMSNPGLLEGLLALNDMLYVGRVANTTQGFQIEARAPDSWTIQARWPDDVTTLHPDIACRFRGVAYEDGAILVIPSLGSLFVVQFSAEHTPRLLWRRRFRDEASVAYTIAEAV